MEAPIHKFSELFKQLGLPDDPLGIDQFITSHSPLKGDVKLVDAPFWNDAQRGFSSKASRKMPIGRSCSISSMKPCVVHENKAPSGT